MKPTLAIYLAGSIQKGAEQLDDSFWTDQHMARLRTSLPNYQLAFLNPAFRTDDLSDQRSVFGRDMLQVFSSHIVFVDARKKRGLGVGAEMMWAKFHQIPVITWAPRNSHYRQEDTLVLGVPVQNFIHPFVESLSDHVVETLEEGAAWIQEAISNPSIAIKGLRDIESAMQHYKQHQLHRDLPMRDLFASSQELEKRAQRTVS